METKTKQDVADDLFLKHQIIKDLKEKAQFKEKIENRQCRHPMETS